MPWQQNGLSTQTSSRGNWVGKIYIHGGYDRTMCRWGGVFDSREGTGISHLRSLLCDSTMKSRWNRHQQITNLHDHHLGFYWMYHIANSIQTIDGIGIVPSLTQNNLRDVEKLKRKETRPIHEVKQYFVTVYHFSSVLRLHLVIISAHICFHTLNYCM